MTTTYYELYFDEHAKKEWDALDGNIRKQFGQALKRRRYYPRVPSCMLSGDLRDCYKIKLRQAGYRLVYRVDDGQIIILVVAIGRRDKNAVYQKAQQRVRR